MTLRKVVEIDEEKCNGCGDCIPNCPEGALQIVDGKARLVSDRYCDGLGACLGVCPQDAIRVIEREADDFDEEAVAALRSAEETPSPAGHAVHAGGCPGAALLNFGHAQAPAEFTAGDGAGGTEPRPSTLTQWPVQLRLVPTDAPFFEGADLLLAADCVPFALAGFHERLLRGRKLLIGCPKLDNSTYYAEKLTEILKRNDVKSLTVAHMEVPCCFGLMGLAQRALDASGKAIPLEEVTIGLRGEIKDKRTLSEAEAPVGG
ncbi:MAG: ATP-binding protein [Planctomycetota bacterium]|jgi:Pyruvate/2-oxoacid:ferredoxin oxidoreductase delta subunit